MPIGGGGGGGGGLPSQWAIGSNGSLTITLTGASGDHDFARAMRIFNSDGSVVLDFNSTGELNIAAADADAHPFAAQGTTKTIVNTDANVVTLGSYPVLKALNTAISDALVNDGNLALWFDKTNGAPKLMVKAKQADGTVVTAAIALA